MNSSEKSVQSTMSVRNSFKKFSINQIIKWNEDITTLNNLQKYALLNQFDFVISGGYAVEAHCGGIMTRLHKDLDTALYRSDNKEFDQAKETKDVAKLLTQEFYTKWILNKIQTSGKIDFRENDPKKSWEEKRMLEINLYLNLSKDNFQNKILYNSKGESFEFYVEHINLLVANKIRIIYSNLKLSKEQNDLNPRPLKKQDIIEIKRLINLNDFSKDECIIKMSNYFQEKENIKNEDALIEAKKQLDFILQNIK